MEDNLAILRELVELARAGKVGEVFNPVEYAPLVQDSRYQVGVHQGRWLTMQQASEDLMAHIDSLKDSILSGVVSGGSASEAIARLNRALENMVTMLRRYPPAPAGSRYIRTGELGAGWGYR